MNTKIQCFEIQKIHTNSSTKWQPARPPYQNTVCELDLVFSLHKSLLILFEMFIGGMVCESSKREVLKQIVEAEELVEEMTKPGEDTASQLDDGLSFQEQFQLGRKPGRRTQGGPAR